MQSVLQFVCLLWTISNVVRKKKQQTFIHFFFANYDLVVFGQNQLHVLFEKIHAHSFILLNVNFEFFHPTIIGKWDSSLDKFIFRSFWWQQKAKRCKNTTTTEIAHSLFPSFDDGCVCACTHHIFSEFAKTKMKKKQHQHTERTIIKSVGRLERFSWGERHVNALSISRIQWRAAHNDIHMHGLWITACAFNCSHTNTTQSIRMLRRDAVLVDGIVKCWPPTSLQSNTVNNRHHVWMAELTPLTSTVFFLQFDIAMIHTETGM